MNEFFSSLFKPQVAEAATTIKTLVAKVNKVLINPLILLIFAVSLVYFVFGVVMFLINRNVSDEKLKTAKDQIFWGVIGMTIMASVFGIMNLILNTLGVDNITVN